MFGWLFGEDKDEIAKAELAKAVAENNKILAGMKDVVSLLREGEQEENAQNASMTEWLEQLREEGRS
jgi:hypothetical protein